MICSRENEFYFIICSLPDVECKAFDKLFVNLSIDFFLLGMFFTIWSNELE